MATWGATERRELARRLTRAGQASVEENLANAKESTTNAVARIGITGPPGAGKSTLIARLAEVRLKHRSRIGVLAIDPTSPLSGGSILGDRIRMDAIAGNPNLYIRSMPSRHAHDGLADNMTEMLSVMEQSGFDDVVLETVGIGQADYTIRTLVDTVVLVVVPESGDAIQAMKAGIMEMADIYVVNKADRPGAKATAADIQSILDLKSIASVGWRPEVILTSNEEGDLSALDEAIERHLDWTRKTINTTTQRRARMRHHVESLITRRLDELLDDSGPEFLDQSIDLIYDDLVRKLRFSES